MNRPCRAAAWLLAALLAAVPFAGCAAPSSGGKPPSARSEPMEISVAFWDLAENMMQDDPALRLLEQRLNISIKPIPIKIENYMQQIQMWASTGQLPDVFSVDAVNSQYYRSWRDRGVIKPIPDDLSAYPHLQQYLSLPGVDGLKDDGRLYFIPRQTYDSTDYNVLDRIVVYRWDLARQAGIDKEPETWEEFRTMLKAIVDRDPENKNVQGLTAIGNLLIGGLFWLYSSPAATSDGSGSDFKWIKEDGRYIPAVFSKHSIESLKLLREFYDSGLIDPDLPVTRGEMARDKFAEGKAAALILAGGAQNLDVSIYKERWLKLHPEDTDTDFYNKVKLLKPLPAIDGNRYHAVFKTFWSESYVSAKVDDRKMARILELFDYMNSDEFKEMRRFGLENVDYVKENGRIKPLDPSASVMTKYKAFSTFASLLDWDGMYKLDPDYVGISPEAKEAQRELIDYSMRMTRKQIYEPRLTQLSTPTKDGFTIFDSDDMIRVMISDLPVEAAWQTIIDGYKEKGLDRMVEEVNVRARELGIE
ncbi:extracellular solute-binding protein [Cohnella hongkongensis]|uniref:Extracellular solute-binding protein n=1 Tax=Cohnella hongkongensis TaxID=178337 RepID=A0ABV9FBL3_9BACL